MPRAHLMQRNWRNLAQSLSSFFLCPSQSTIISFVAARFHAVILLVVGSSRLGRGGVTIMVGTRKHLSLSPCVICGAPNANVP